MCIIKENKISIKNLSFSYDKKTNQLKNIDFNVKKGECIVLIGKSGCGKSSLTRVINGLIPNFYKGNLQGSIFIEGKNIQNLSSWEIGKLTGNVFQDPRSQFFSNQVGGEIAFGCENLGLSQQKIIKSVKDAANELGLQNILKEDIYTLSYGMRQKVAIASAKAIDPEIFIFDEPSANLDIESIKILKQIISCLKKLKKTIIISEHRLFYLKDIASKYILMEDGKITKEYSQKQLNETNGEKLKQIGLRNVNLENIDFYKKPISQKKTVQFEVLNISKNIKKKNILKNINFKFFENEIVALIGKNGTGKSMFGKIISGITKQSKGKIVLNSKEKKSKQILGKIWYIPQDLDSQLFGENLVDELITGLKYTDKINENAEKILMELDLYKLKNKHPSTLSGGQKQRLALGVSIMHNAKIIVLDEPTSGLDGNNMKRVSEVIRKINKKGTKILIISHDIEFIAKTCDRVIKLDKGEIIEDYYLNLSSRKKFLQSMEY